MPAGATSVHWYLPQFCFKNYVFTVVWKLSSSAIICWWWHTYHYQPFVATGLPALQCLLVQHLFTDISRSLHSPTLSGWTLLDCHWTLVWKIWWKWVRIGVIFWSLSNELSGRTKSPLDSTNGLSNGLSSDCHQTNTKKHQKKSLELIAYKSCYTSFWSDFWAEFRYIDCLVIQWCDILPFWSNIVLYMIWIGFLSWIQIYWCLVIQWCDILHFWSNIVLYMIWIGFLSWIQIYWSA